ncbi:uncharacterized protein LOC109818053 [Cajanus cajan]|uniref:Uncharacterized protein n=1 Tax=Cajanus cajan TaxID=3821 RepID=A0A151RK99_CAJCA|nr:uncharacterized protein LOC109818053 [Cajanus cajan]KYP42962.1 hypothetical protein KK1_035625 [Cajanus cajan]
MPPNHPFNSSTTNINMAVSDITFEEEVALEETRNDESPLATVSEVDSAKCECCGMCEECTLEYIRRVRDMFSGRLICGLCAEAVNVEMEKNGGKREEALKEHMSDCFKFNWLGRSYPHLYQAENVKKILKKNIASRNRDMSKTL